MRLRQRLEEVLGDMRLAVRQLKSAPGFTLVAALTLALGIGVNSAIFSLADAALMRPLPLGQAERLVMLWERPPTSPKTGVSPLNMRDWNGAGPVLEGMAFVQRGDGRRTAADRARRLQSRRQSVRARAPTSSTSSRSPGSWAERSSPRTTAPRRASRCSAKPLITMRLFLSSTGSFTYC